MAMAALEQTQSAPLRRSMDEFLTPIRTTYLTPRGEQLAPAEAARSTSNDPSTVSSIHSADDALSLLKSQPGHDLLTAVLQFLTAHQPGSSFNIHHPSPKTAALVQVLVSEIAPNYWTTSQQGSSAADAPLAAVDKDRLTQCLRSVTGINALVGQITALVRDSRLSGPNLERPNITLRLVTYLDLLAALLDGSGSIYRIWRSSTACLTDASSRKVQSQILVSLIASGKILSVSAEALGIVGSSEHFPVTSRWLADGVEFSKWLGSNVAAWAKSKIGDDAELQSCFDFFQRSLSLGYADTVVNSVIDQLVLSQESPPSLFPKVCLHQPHVSKKVLFILLDYLSRKFFNHLPPRHSIPNETISAVAGIIDGVVQKDQGLIAHLVNWSCSPSGAGLGDGTAIRRAVIAVLAKDKETITSVLEKSLSQFGDQLYIKHTAILQQEAHVQVLLLSAGYVARLSPLKLTMLLRSATYINTISNRIASTHARARFLGMCVGEGLSALQDGQTKKLDFHMDEMDSQDAQWLKSLPKISDSLGSPELLLSQLPRSESVNSQMPSTPIPMSNPRPKPKPKPKIAASQPTPKAIIEEIDSSDDEENDDEFETMEKGSDTEDSEDDATLVRRNKPKPPVYVRDLMTYLRDSESHDKQELGIQTAPLLIRRKASFGAEVSSHAEELARLFVGLQNKFDMENFEDLRLQGMMALIVAQPKSMGPWFARTFFEGDYSLSQRSSVLLSLGLSARELAGLEASEYQSVSGFPSKRLPEKMERLYIEPTADPSQTSQRLKALPPNALDTIAQSLTASFLGPLAAEAADTHSGPDALKLQTFSARHKSRNKMNKPRARAIPNTTAALLSTCFFSPLTAHFQFALRSSKPVVLNPALLALYLQTLAIVVNAAGPSTLSLPQLTSELWDLLLRVRVHVVDDLGAKRGWLVAMSVLLEVNQDSMRRVCQEQSREMVESREWVSAVFEGTRGDDGGEENDVKMLAAGVLIRLNEAIEKYQALLMGDLLSFH